MKRFHRYLETGSVNKIPKDSVEESKEIPKVDVWPPIAETLNQCIMQIVWKITPEAQPLK